MLSLWNKRLTKSDFGKDQNARAIVDLARNVSLLWEHTIRVPANAREVLDALHSPEVTHLRPSFHYDTPDAAKLKNAHESFLSLREHFFVTTKENPESWFDFAEQDVRRSYLRLIAFKIKVLSDPESYVNDPISLTLLRESFCLTTPAYRIAARRLQRAMRDPRAQHAATLYTTDKVANEAAMALLKEQVEECIPKIIALFSEMPESLYKELQKQFVVDLEFTEEPGALLRCITRPEENRIIIQLAKDKAFPKPLLRLAAAHELGHAASSALFDRVLSTNGYVSALWTFAGISSPNPFDPKEEAFADLLAETLSSEEDKILYWHRKNIWLPARVVADYLYHIKGESIGSIISLFRQVGLVFAAEDEAFSVAAQFTSLKAQYFFGHFEAERLKRLFQLDTRALLTVLLLAGNASYPAIFEWLGFLRAKEKAPLL